MPLVPIRTERLLLRDWTDADLLPLSELVADPVVMEHFPSPLDRAASDAMAARARAAIASRGYGFFVVEIPGVTTFAGIVGLLTPTWALPFRVVASPPIEIGWRLARAYWGAGIAREAARACLRAGFDELGAPEIFALTVPDNRRSRRVMEAIGMTRDPADDFDHPLLANDDRLRRHVLYRIGRAVFRARHG